MYSIDEIKNSALPIKSLPDATGVVDNGAQTEAQRAEGQGFYSANSIAEGLSNAITSTFEKATNSYVFNDKSQRSVAAQNMGQNLGINPDVLMGVDRDTWDYITQINGQRSRVKEVQDLYRDFPELNEIKFKNQAEAVELLQNMTNARKTQGIWDSLQQGVWSMNDQMKMADAGYQLAYTNDAAKREELYKEIDRLQSNLNKYRTIGSDGWETVIGQTAQQAYMMGKQALVGAGERGAEGMALGAAAGAGIGTAFAGVGAAPGAVAGGLTGLSTGIKVGMGEQMQHMSFGLKYLDLINKKDSQGNRIYSDEEARNRAAAYSVVDTGIEYASLRVAGKAIKAAVPTGSVISKILASEGLAESFKRGGIAVARNYVKTGIKTGGAELIEEGLQDINEKVQTNLFGKAGDDTYSAEDIGIGAIQAMVQAAPAVLGLGILGGLGGGIRTASQFRAFNRMSTEQQQMVVQSEINTRGNDVLKAVISDSEDNVLAQKNPDLYIKVIQSAANAKGIGQVYVNIQDMINTEEGQAAVQNLVDNGLITQDEVTKSIENDTSIEVPIGQFAQLNTQLEDTTMKELENNVYYTEGGMSLQNIQKAVNTAKAMREYFAGEYAARQENVRNEIMKEFSEHNEVEQEMADLVVGANPYAIKSNFNEMYTAMEEDLRETYADELEPGVNFDAMDMSQVDNSQGHYDNLTNHGKARRVAFERAKQNAINGFETGMTEEAQKIALAKFDAMEQKLIRLEAMDKIKDRLYTIADGDVYVRSNLSPEAYEVYQSMVSALKEGNLAISKSAKENGLVFATHADVVADIMRRAGYKNYTAKDYVDKYIEVKVGNELNAESKLKEDTKRWGKLVADFIDDKIKGYRHRVMSMPLVYQMIGVQNKEIFIENNILKKVIKEKHSEKYDIEALKQLPAALADPIAVFKNYDSTTGTVKEDSFIAIISIKSNTGKLTNVPISFNKNKDGYFIISIFPRENFEWYKQQLKHDRLLYINRSKKDAISTSGQSTPNVVEIASPINDSIPNEEDLRKLKEGNPGWYQKGYEEDLVAMHNISEDNLKGVLQLGGMPVPSIAVTKKHTPYNKYAAITLIMSKETANPEKEDVFTRDAWTTTFPRVLRKPLQAKLGKLLDEIKETSGETGLKLYTDKYDMANYWDDENAYSKLEDALGTRAAKYYYLMSIGKAPKLKMISAVGEDSYLKDKAVVKKVAPLIKEITDKGGISIASDDAELSERIANVMREIMLEEANRKIQERLATLTPEQIANEPAFVKRRYENLLKKIDEETKYSLIFKFENRIYREYKLLDKKIADIDKLESDIDKALERPMTKKGYDAWVKENMDTMLDTPTIKVGNSKVPLTLDNIVEAMVGNTKNEQEGVLGRTSGNVIAASADTIKDYESMHKLADEKLDTTQDYDIDVDSNTSFVAVKEEINDIVNTVLPWYSYKGAGFEKFTDALEALIDIVGDKQEADVVKSFKKYSYNVPAGQRKALIERINTLKENIANLKTNYFEAKPQRAVRLNEITYAVVPKTTDKELVRELKANGIKVAKYDVEVEGDREKVTNAAQDKAKQYFQKVDASKVRGLTSVYENGRRLIQLFESANFSTFVHESGHVFLEDLQMLANMEGAPKDVIKDWEAVKAWTGYVEGGDAETNRAAHEKFATGFEAYLREGKAPTKLLERTFRRFKEWLTAIYHSVTTLGGLPPKEIQDVMARMLAVQSEIDSYTAQQGLDSFEKSKIYNEMTGEEQKEFMLLIDSVREGAKEKVLKAYMKELEGRADKAWEEQRETIRKDIMESYAEKYPVYEARMIYDTFGEAGLINTPYKTVAELKKGEAEALGDWDTLIKNDMQAAHDSLTEAYTDPAEIRRLADEYMLTHEGQQKVAIAEAEAIKKYTNRSVAANYEIIAALSSIKVFIPERIEKIVKAVEEKADRATVKKVKEIVNKAKETNNGTANEKVVEALKDALQEYIANMRALRNLSVGNVDNMMAKAHDSLRRLTVTQGTSFKHYQNKSVTESRLADIALAKGKMDEAFYHKQQQLLYQAMARAAYDNAEDIKSMEKDLKTKHKALSRPKNPVRIAPEARYFVGHLLYQMGLTDRDATLPNDGFAIESIFNLLDPDMDLMDRKSNLVMDPWIVDVFNEGKPWRKLTIDEFTALHQIVSAVYTRGLAQYESTTLINEDGKAVSFEEAVGEMIAQGERRLKVSNKDPLAIENEKGKVERAKNKIARLMMDLIKPEVILRRFDDDRVGPWTRYIYDPLDRATRKGKELFEVATRRLSQTFGIYSNKELLLIRTERMYNMGAVTSMTKEQIIALALNWGTKDNRQRVKETLQIESETAIEGYFSNYLTDKDWDFIESVWDFINSYYEERSAVQERLYGTPLNEVPGVEFTIQGRKIQGQYYPIVYDPRLDGAANDYEVEDIIRSQMSSNAVWGMGMSATKSRTKIVKGKKLMLSFDVIPRAIDEAINHIAMREAAIDVNKLLSNRDLSNYITNATNVETLQLLRKWVRDNWQAEIVRMNQFDRMIMAFKANTSFAIMAYRTSTALLNVLNVIPMMYEQGVRQSISAILNFYGNPFKIKEKREFVENRSVFIRERRYNLDKDMKEGLSVGQKGSTFMANDDVGRRYSTTKQAIEDARDWINNYGYAFITETDLMLSMPLWKMAYDQAVAEYMDKDLSTEEVESRAVIDADRAVRRVFGSGEVKDAPVIQRSRNSLINLFTPFYTYANTVLNALVEGGYAVYDKRDYGKLFNAILFWVVLQGMAEGLLRASMDDDDDDAMSLMQKVSGNVVNAGIGGLPLIRDAFGISYDVLTGGPAYSRGNEATALSFIPKIIDLSRLLSKESATWIDVMRTSGQISNRFIGFSDTISDGFWTLAKWSLMDTDATVMDMVKAIVFDRKIKSKDEKRRK